MEITHLFRASELFFFEILNIRRCSYKYVAVLVRLIFIFFLSDSLVVRFIYLMCGEVVNRDSNPDPCT